MSNIFKKIGRGISKLTAAAVEGVAGTLTGIFVFNPAYTMIKRVKYTWLEGINLTPLMNLFFEPVYWPINTLSVGFAQQTQMGWDKGFDWDIKARQRLANNYIHSRQDFIFSLIILGLVVLAILAIFFPATFGVAALLPNIIASLGLASLAPWALAIVVGTVGTMLLATLYGIGSIWFYRGFTLPSVLPGKQGFEINIFSRIAGALVGAVWGTISALVVYNPVTVLISHCRRFLQDKNLQYLVNILFTPVDIIYFILVRGFANQFDYGWQYGFREAFKSHHVVYRNSGYAKRDVIAGLIFTGLVTLAVLAVLFPATFGIAAVLPSIVAAVGLSGVSTPVLAAIAGAAALIFLTVSYGIGSALYDRYHTPKLPAGEDVQESLDKTADVVDETVTGIASSTAKVARHTKDNIRSALKKDDEGCLDSLWQGFNNIIHKICPCDGEQREEPREHLIHKTPL